MKTAKEYFEDIWPNTSDDWDGFDKARMISFAENFAQHTAQERYDEALKQCNERTGQWGLTLKDLKIAAGLTKIE